MYYIWHVKYNLTLTADQWSDVMGRLEESDMLDRMHQNELNCSKNAVSYRLTGWHEFEHWSTGPKHNNGNGVARPRTLVAKYVSLNDREKVRKAAPVLKKKTRHFPKSIPGVRKILYPVMRQPKQQSEKVYLRVDTIYIDGSLLRLQENEIQL